MIIGEKRERPSITPIILVFGLSLVLSIGFELSMHPALQENPNYLAAARSAFAVVFTGMILGLISSERLVVFRRLPPLFTSHRIAISLCCISFVISSVFVLIKSSPKYPAQANMEIIAFGLAASFFFLLYAIQLAIRRAGYPATILLISAASHSVLTYFHLQSTPLDAAQTIPFSRYYEAINLAFNGLNPYHVYGTILHHPFSYLPGHWLSYSASKFLDFDPRWIGGCATLISIFLIYWAVPKDRRHIASYCLSLYFLLPCLIISNHSDTGILPLCLTLTLLLFARQYYLLGSAVLGLSLTLSLFSWLLLPFLLLFLFKQRPFLTWGAYLLMIGLFCLILLIPFFNGSPELFLTHTVKYWLESDSGDGLSLAYWLVPLIGTNGLYFLQMVFFIVLFVQFLKSKKSLAACYSYAAVYAVFFIAVSRISETSLLPIILLLALIGLIFSDDYKSTQAPVKIHLAPRTNSTKI